MIKNEPRKIDRRISYNVSLPLSVITALSDYADLAGVRPGEVIEMALEKLLRSVKK